jgi:hypothetical protein
MDEITNGLLAACKAALPHFPSHKSKVGHQLRAAIAMAELGQVPRRSLAERLQLEADAVGAGLDEHSLEQGEIA